MVGGPLLRGRSNCARNWAIGRSEAVVLAVEAWFVRHGRPRDRMAGAAVADGQEPGSNLAGPGAAPHIVSSMPLASFTEDYESQAPATAIGAVRGADGRQERAGFAGQIR
jgi:hypothetical protein